MVARCRRCILGFAALMARIWQRLRDLGKRDMALESMQLAMDYRAVFGTPGGQRVLADLLQRAGLAQTTFRAGQADMTAYLEGRRRIGLEVVEMINSDPDAVAAMLSAGETEHLYP
jgi:hypothetical protein